MCFSAGLHCVYQIVTWTRALAARLTKTVKNYFKTTIPQPWGIFPVGNITEFVRVLGPKAHDWLMKRCRQYGSVYQFKSLGKRMVFVFRLRDLVSLRRCEGRYPEHFEFKHLRLYRKQKALPYGLLVSSGEEWRRHRRCIGRVMLGMGSVNKYYTEIDEIAMETVRGLPEETDKEIEMDDIISLYVLQTMSRVLLGNEDKEAPELREIIEIAGSNFSDAKILLSLPTFLYPLLPAWKRHSARWDRLLEITEEYIRIFKQNVSEGERKPSVLWELIYNSDMTEPETHINITDLILASIDTTTSTILWVLHEISRHPSAQQKVQEEIDHVTGSRHTITLSELQNLVFLRSVLKESQRLHPVGFFASRYIQEEMDVDDIRIEKGSHVAASMYVIGQDQELFDEPKKFKPQRWREENTELDDFYNHVPFGFGKRMCIGKRIAETVIMSFLFHLLRCRTISSKNREPIDPVFRVIMVPGKPVTMALTPRQDHRNNI